jgi:signal transduction histidine kinase
VEDLSLHILDIAENAIRAAASVVEVDVEERQGEDALTITISDDGRGMSREELDKALDPFFTTKSHKRVGLGLPLLAQAAREAGGDMRYAGARDVHALAHRLQALRRRRRHSQDARGRPFRSRFQIPIRAGGL